MNDGGGGSHPPFNRRSVKRDFRTMAADHRSGSGSTSLFTHDNDQVNDDHTARRIRLHTPTLSGGLGTSARPRLPRTRYAGDGFDLRRPMMSTTPAAESTAGAARRRDSSVHGNERVRASSRPPTTIIDLTDEDGDDSQASERPGPAPSTARPLTFTSRPQRLPRFGRNVIDAHDSGGETEQQTSHQHLPGANYLALPQRNSSAGTTRRPQFSSLRRPARAPSPPMNVDANLDEVEILDAIPRSVADRVPTPARSRNVADRVPTPAAGRHNYMNPGPYEGNTIDLTADDDDIVILNERQREGANLQSAGTNLDRPASAAGHFGIGHLANMIGPGSRLMERIAGWTGFNGGMTAHEQQLHLDRDIGLIPPARAQNGNGARNRPPLGNPRLDVGGRAPRIMQMDYTGVGFDMGLQGGNRPPTPKYSPPPEPGEGFTRSPEENEVIVCPNCGDELAVSEALDGIKGEVWIVKTCGHAYCGECAHNRGKSTPKKGKGKAIDMDADFGVAGTGVPPLKKCVVEGCGRPASARSMIRIYLGS